MNESEQAIDAFLASVGWAGAARLSIGADWSNRRYARLMQADSTAVLMDGGADGPVERFIGIARWLRGIGLHAPEVLASDEGRRLVLLEDLGSDLVAAVAERHGNEAELYLLATDAILRFQSAEPPSGLPILDDTALLGLLELFLDFEAVHVDEAARHQFRELWRELAPLATTRRPVFLYRDYHAENLMWLPSEHGLWRLGLLDFQDAHLGPEFYDIVSLVEDARRDVSTEVRALILDYYHASRKGVPGDPSSALAVLGAHRALRILGVVARLRASSGRTFPAGLVARVRGYLARNLGHPSMVGVRHWCERYYPVP